MISPSHWAWFDILRPGDPIAVRLSDPHFNRPWKKGIVVSRTQKTVWWEVHGTPWLNSKANIRTQEWDVRPWTEEDEAMEWAVSADTKIRAWLDKHVPRGPYASPKPLDSEVRSALVRLLAGFGVEF